MGIGEKSYDLHKASSVIIKEDSMNVVNAKKSQSQQSQKGRITCRFVLAVFGAVLGSFQFGYGLGVVNNAEKPIKEFINETEFDRTGSEISDTKLTNLWAIAVAIFSIGGCIGGFSGGWVAKSLGRRRGCIANALLGIVCACMLGASKRAGTFELFIAGRILTGIQCGIYTAIIPVYLSEISAVHIRGAVGTLHQLAVVTGILGAQILGFPSILGTPELWDFLCAFPVIPCGLQIVSLCLSPDSPRFALACKGNLRKARSALEEFRGVEDVDDELDEIQKETSKNQEQVSIVQLFMNPALRPPLIIGIVMQCSQQLNGINGVFFYSTSLFQDVGLSQSKAMYVTSSVGAILFVMTLVTVPLMDRAGRRTLHLIGLGGMAVVGVLITISLNLRNIWGAFEIISVLVTLLYVVFFAIGPGSIPWIIVAELFSTNARPAALSVCVLINWMTSFIIGYIFPFIQDGLGDYTFAPFTVLVVLMFIFTYLKVPETKGKTFEEITSIWQDRDPSYNRMSVSQVSGKPEKSAPAVKSSTSIE